MKYKENLFKELNRSKAFIYSINHKYYFLGAGISRLCSENESGAYEKYLIEMKKIEETKEIEVSLCKEDVMNLEHILNDIYKYGNCKSESQNELTSSEILWKIIDECSNDDLNNLSEQRNTFIKALDYIDGAFYRHVPLDKYDNINPVISD